MLMGRLSPPVALRLALQGARATADTTSALLLYRSLIDLQPFDERLPEEAARMASTSGQEDDASADIALIAFKRTGDGRFQGLLAAIALRRGALGDAALLLDRLERANPQDPTTLYNQARLHVLLGDTARAGEYFRRYTSGR